MAIYEGPAYTDGGVSIFGVEQSLVLDASSEDVRAEVEEWSARAATDGSMVYFGIAFEAQVVGQIFLHDLDFDTKESLVGYHIFEPWRRRGIGTEALRLLQQYVTRETNLRRVVAITTDSNLASRALGAACGFCEIGASREDPAHGVVMEWQVARYRRNLGFVA